MSNPQAENGHTDIANEIMDALARIRIPGEAMQVLLAILRKTYGWHKKDDAISLSQFVEATRMRKSSICKAISKLRSMKLIITKKGNNKYTTYCFNKNYDTWKSLPKKEIFPKKETNITQKGNKSLPKSRHTKESITKETITKEKRQYMVEPSFDRFWEIYPKKVGKAPCFKKWCHAVKDDEQGNKIVIALQNQIRLKYISDDKKYCPNPLTWLNQERWTDEIKEEMKCDTCGTISLLYLDDDTACDCGGTYKSFVRTKPGGQRRI